MAKILVLGSTGAVGTEVAQALSAKGVQFKAAVRTAAKAEKVKNLPGAQLVEVDMQNQESLANALEGVEKLFLLTPPSLTFLGKGIVEQAKKAGVKHIVKLSGLGSEEKDPTVFVLATDHTPVEDFIKSEGIPLTSLRPSYFFSNIYQDIPTIKQGSIEGAYGDARVNWVANSDIADVAVAALTQPGHEGKEYYITGSDSLTANDVAKMLSDVLGREIKYCPISDEEWRKQAAKYFPPAMVETHSNMNTYFRNGGYDRKFDDYERVTGKKPQGLRPWLEAHQEAFQ